jgi:hypothetical protein
MSAYSHNWSTNVISASTEKSHETQLICKTDICKKNLNLKKIYRICKKVDNFWKFKLCYDPIFLWPPYVLKGNKQYKCICT